MLHGCDITSSGYVIPVVTYHHSTQYDILAFTNVMIFIIIQFLSDSLLNMFQGKSNTRKTTSSSEECPLTYFSVFFTLLLLSSFDSVISAQKKTLLLWVTGGTVCILIPTHLFECIGMGVFWLSNNALNLCLFYHWSSKEYASWQLSWLLKHCLTLLTYKTALQRFWDGSIQIIQSECPS